MPSDRPIAPAHPDARDPAEEAAFLGPFDDPEQAVAATRELFSLFSALRPVRGLSVLEHQCGTAWLARLLARIGLKVVACDADHAMLGRAVAFTRRQEPGLLAAGRLRFLGTTDPAAIPLPDAAVERTVMRNAFHRAPDRAALLAELFRVLAEDGRAVFIEPGPGQKPGTGPAGFDLLLEEVWPLAEAAGFGEIELALGNVEVPYVPLPDFARQVERVAARRAADEVQLGQALRGVDRFVATARHFVLVKPIAEPDTRRAKQERERNGPPGRIEILEATARGRRLVLRVALVNTSVLTWRASGGERGAVNLGVQLRRGEEIDRNFRRIRIAAEPTAPGARREVAVSLPMPPAGSDYLLDLVAEQVCWFTAPVDGAEKLDQALPPR